MRYILLVLAFLLTLVGCAEPTPPVPPLVGDWTLRLQIEGQLRMLPAGDWQATSCVGAPRVHLELVGTDSLDGDILPGAGSDLLCNGAPFSWDGWLVGTHQGESVALFDGYCRYTGTAAGGPVSCTENTGAVELDMGGTWRRE